jgi:predicted transcriptional regulator
VVRAVLEGEPVSRFMKSDPVTVPADIAIEDLVNNYVYHFHYKMFPVLSRSGEVVGCVTTQRIKTVPRQEWRLRSVLDVMEPVSPENTISPDTDAMHALSLMNTTARSRLIVVESGKLVGVLALKDLLNFLSLKLDLEGRPAELSRTAGS